MKSKRHNLPLLLLITAIVTFSIFYLFEEEKACLLDFGTKCSNRFLLRCSVQTIIMTAVFYFSMRRNPEKK